MIGSSGGISAEYCPDMTTITILHTPQCLPLSLSPSLPRSLHPLNTAYAGATLNRPHSLNHTLHKSTAEAGGGGLRMKKKKVDQAGEMGRAIQVFTVKPSLDGGDGEISPRVRLGGY